jgi:hypothetical protein
MFWRLDLLSSPCGMWKGKNLPWWAHSKEQASNLGDGSLLSLFHLKIEANPVSKTLLVVGLEKTDNAQYFSHK